MASVHTIGVDVRHLLSSHPSGVGLSTQALLDAMISQTDASTAKFVLFANAASKQEGIPAAWLEHDHVQILNPGIPNRLLNAGVFVSGYPRLDKLMGNIDVLWSPNVLFLGVSPKIRLALTVHDLSFVLLPETYSAKRRLWHKAVRAVELMKRADTLFAVSETTKRDLISLLHISEQKIVVVPHGAPKLPEKGMKPSEWNVPEDEPFVLFLSTIEPRKNVVALLEAFEQMCEKTSSLHHFVLAGSWGWKPNALQEAIKRSPVKDRIHVLGYVSEEEKVWLLERAIVLAFPSLYEGFGLPPLEAFAKNVPVLASSTSAVAETVGDAAVLVNPYDVGEISFGLEQVMIDASLRMHLIAKGKERLKAFSWDRSATIALDALRCRV